jgi:hypothetical protein
MNQLIVNLLLGSGVSVSSILTVLAFKQSRRKREAEIGLDETTKAKLAAEAAQINEKREQARDKRFQDDIDRLDQQLKDERLISLERGQRLNRLERLVNRHTQWDFIAVARLREAGIDIEDPPSLMYLDADGNEMNGGKRRG